MNASLETDIDAVGRIDVVRKTLDAVRGATDAALVALVRVTPEACLVCAASDAASPGAMVGDEMEGAGAERCRRVARTGESVVDDAAPGGETGFAFPVVLGDGSFFGVLYARAVRDMPPAQTPALFADLVAAQVDDAMRLEEAQRALRDERDTAELRERFVAMLGHDLRNTVASLESGTRMLLQMPLGHNAATVATLLQGSAGRLNGFTDSLLDMARGRLGDSLTVMRRPDAALLPVLHRTIDGIRATTTRRIDARLDFEDPVNCDAARIGQLAANLVGNAVRHGDAGSPVTVRAWRAEGMFHFSVANAGAPIPEEKRAELFLPFSRRQRENREGAGLGLYIAAEIARRHRGEIACVSTPEETRFTLTMAA